LQIALLEFRTPQTNQRDPTATTGLRNLAHAGPVRIVTGAQKDDIKVLESAKSRKAMRITLQSK